MDSEINEMNNAENNYSFNINSTLKTIIVALISIPIILFIVVILYKIVKKIKENTNKTIIRNNEMIENYNDSNQNCVDYKNVGLKSKINNMRSQIFVKQNKNFNDKNKFPSFPYYDSDDDLL
jgi:predicted PurR-regulated permease PerM